MPIQIEEEEKSLLKEITIPPRPQSLLTIWKESKQENPNFAVISKAIVDDVSTSAAVLQVVNSPAFRRVAAITSIDKALSMLGLKRVISIVNAVAVKSATKANEDLEDFWAMASTVATVNVLICKASGLAALTDDAYTLGLFHMSGVPLMMNKFEGYSTFFRNAEQEGWVMSIDKEKQEYRTTHTTIGALLAQDWALPDSIVFAINNVHYADGIFDEPDIDATSLNLLAILKLGREIAHCQLGKGGRDEWEQVESQVLKQLKLDESKFDRFKQAVIESFENA